MDPNTVAQILGALLDTGSAALRGGVELGAAGVELATRILELVLAVGVIAGTHRPGHDPDGRSSRPDRHHD